jgi:cell division septation protein DedD
MGVAPPAPAAPQGTEEIAGSAPQVSEVENGSRPEAQPLEETQPPQDSSGPAPPPVVEGGYAVHVSSYKAVSRAESEASALRTKGYEVEVVTADLGDSGIWYRVCVGRVPTRAEADALAERLKDVEGFSYTRVVKRPGPRPQG